MSKGVKIFFSIIIFLALLGSSFIGIIFTALIGGGKFYTALIAVSGVMLFVFFVVAIFNIGSRKSLKIAIISYLILAVVAISGYESYDAYKESLRIANDTEVDLYQYQPFAEDTKAVSLDEPATLKLEDDLPILDGATALYPLYSAFVQAIYPEKSYEIYGSEVMVNKTNEAYQNLFDGVVDVIFVAGPSERQLQEAERRGLKLTLTPIGREAFVFFVNAKNPVKNLTVEQIKGIYSGEITNWSEVGGKNEKIRPFQRPDDSGSQTALENLMGDVPLMVPPKEDIVTGMGGIIEQTANYYNYKNAIGYTFRFFSDDMVQNGKIRHLEINGVFPEKETIRNGKYPLTAEFYAITAGTDNPNVERFIEWILSEQGQALVEKTGYVPVNEF